MTGPQLPTRTRTSPFAGPPRSRLALVSAGLAGLPGRIQDVLPRGRTLTDAEWSSRHRVILALLWGHVVALPVFLLFQGFGIWGSIAPTLPVAAAGAVGMRPDVDRRVRSIAVVLGLLTASAVLVYGWHGQIEAHFHFFVMIAVLAFYEDWVPFGLAIAYVAIEHGVLGALAPHSVYSHGGSPWLWAGIHAVFVLGASAVAVITWRLNEAARLDLTAVSQRAREESRRFKMSFESGISGMCILDREGNFLQVNRSLCEMLGYDEQELLQTSPSALTHEDDIGREVEAILAAMADGSDVYETEKRYHHRGGGLVWAQVGLRIVRGDDREVEYFLLQVNDITKRKSFEDELEHSALHDDLTGLPNRRLFMDRLESALLRQARRPVPLAVLFVDLDRFKLVNDTFGHTVGDRILAEAGERLERALRSEDTVARFGGDEFTVLCEGAGDDEARRLSERILAALSEPFEHAGREFQLSASVGARVNDSAHTPARVLLQDAGVALYSARQKGGARLELFRPEVCGAEADLLATEQALRHAIANGELRLHYQPELDLISGRVVALEALVRWQHPERGLLGPFEFVPLAEQSELIVSLGEWVLAEACAQMTAWREAGIGGETMRVAVNVSARQLSDPDLANVVGATLERTGLDPSALCLEVTENGLFNEPEVALANLEAIKALGVAIALDDFGVGFSSLSRLRELPRLDVIKIDRSFVSGLLASAPDAAVIRGAVSLGAHLGLTVVAEGIEEDGQRRELQELGCHVGQGFLFCRPEPPQRIVELLSSELPGLGEDGTRWPDSLAA